MQTMKLIRLFLGGLLTAAGLGALPASAWDYDMHRLINQMALASLPTNFPAFVRDPAAAERIAFLSGEPDRWRNTPDLALRHQNGPDHFLDAEELARHGLKADQLSQFRYEFVVQLAAGRAAHVTNFPPVQAAADPDRTRALIGFLPWTITEYYGRLKSAFSYLKEYEAAGRPEEVENARQNVLHAMGVMGHFVGDATQPLHVTHHYNGWVGDNPNGYTTNRGIHAWIDSGFLRAVGVKTNESFSRIRPARPPWEAALSPNTNVFPRMLAYVLEQAQLVEPLYRLEKERKFSPARVGPREEGQEFLTGQMIKAAQMLGDLWFAAWSEAPRDTFLQKDLARRLKTRAPSQSEPAPSASPAQP